MYLTSIFYISITNNEKYCFYLSYRIRKNYLFLSDDKYYTEIIYLFES